MSDFCCAVVFIEGRWTLAYNGRRFGAFDDRVRAFGAAMTLARDVVRAGGRADVLVQTSTGALSLQASL